MTRLGDIAFIVIWIITWFNLLIFKFNNRFLSLILFLLWFWIRHNIVNLNLYWLLTRCNFFNSILFGDDLIRLVSFFNKLDSMVTWVMLLPLFSLRFIDVKEVYFIRFISSKLKIFLFDFGTFNSFSLIKAWYFKSTISSCWILLSVVKTFSRCTIYILIQNWWFLIAAYVKFHF